MLGLFAEHPDFYFDGPDRQARLDRALEELCLEVAEGEFLEFLSEMSPERRRDLRDALHISLFRKSADSRVELGKCIERCWEDWHADAARVRLEEAGD